MLAQRAAKQFAAAEKKRREKKKRAAIALACLRDLGRAVCAQNINREHQ
ncbi:hypothetical protein [Nocardiopsis sp. CNR-923]|nr:hypothetical protein [Nocardiopsis sp. CNR-923]